MPHFNSLPPTVFHIRRPAERNGRKRGGRVVGQSNRCALLCRSSTEKGGAWFPEPDSPVHPGPGQHTFLASYGTYHSANAIWGVAASLAFGLFVAFVFHRSETPGDDGDHLLPRLAGGLLVRYRAKRRPGPRRRRPREANKAFHVGSFRRVTHANRWPDHHSGARGVGCDAGRPPPVCGRPIPCMRTCSDENDLSHFSSAHGKCPMIRSQASRACSFDRSSTPLFRAPSRLFVYGALSNQA